jgi:aryl-alcohol dehydrogenase-like predicted oxidoreductase
MSGTAGIPAPSGRGGRQSILNRGIESEVLAVTQRYGMGTLVWSPLAKGMLTGRIRKGQQTDLRRAAVFTRDP